MKIFGAFFILLGGFLFVAGPSDRRIQIDAFGNTARLFGIILIVIGVIMLKF